MDITTFLKEFAKYGLPNMNDIKVIQIIGMKKWIFVGILKIVMILFSIWFLVNVVGLKIVLG